MTESRLGLGWKPLRRRCWCEEGRISADKARLTSSPSTPPILTSEFVMAERRALSLFGEYDDTAAELEAQFLWRLHRKEPGWFVGEHIQVFFWPRGLIMAERGAAAERDRPGEVERSRENRTEAAEEGVDPYKLTRVGEVVRWKNPPPVEVRVEKLDVEDAKAEEEVYGDGDWWWNRPEAGDMEADPDRSIGPFWCLLEDAAIFVREKKRGE